MQIFTSSFSTQRWIQALPVAFAGMALLVTLTACDSTDSNSDDPEEMSPETVSMSIGENEIEMNAFFAHGEDPEIGEEAFRLIFTEEEDPTIGALIGTGGFAFRTGAQPNTGTNMLINVRSDFFDDTEGDFFQTDEFGFVFWENASPLPPERLYSSNSGEITFTASEDDQVSGSFTMEATQSNVDADGNIESQETVTIEGRFNASRVAPPNS